MLGYLFFNFSCCYFLKNRDMIHTPHFIGLEIKSSLFSNLYLEVYEYLKNNHIEDVIRFQDIFLLHITIHYFRKTLTQGEKSQIKNFIDHNSFDGKIKVCDFNYFYRFWQRSVCYLEIDTDDDLGVMSRNFYWKFWDEFSKKKKSEFIPHITFFRIKDSMRYEQHRENIEIIIKRQLEDFKQKDVSRHQTHLYKLYLRKSWNYWWKET